MKRMLFVLFLLNVFAVQNANAQGWEWARQANGETEGNYCATDFLDNVYGTGVHWGTIYFAHDTVNGAGEFLVKYDIVGNVKWAISTNTVASTSNSLGITTDLFGNEYLFGMYDTSMSFGAHTLTPPGPHNNYYRYYFIAKIDSSGNVKWIKNVGNVTCESASINKSIVTDLHGNIYITCPFSNNPTIGTYSIVNTANDSSNDILVAKFDSSGTIIWAKGYGGRGSECPSGITVTPSEKIFIDGYFYSDTLRFGAYILTDTGALATSGFLAKLDVNGNPVWARDLHHSYLASIGSDTHENVFITGGYSEFTLILGSVTLPRPPIVYSIVAKYDSSGTSLWAKLIQGNFVVPWNLAIDPCDNVWLLSSMGTDHLTTDDTIDGHILAPPAANGDPNFIAGWSNSGVFIQASAIPSGSTDDVNGIAIDKCGDIYVVADMENCSTITIGGDTLVNPSETMFITKYNPNLGCGSCHVNLIPGPFPKSEIIIVFPNPTTTMLTISATVEITSITITNLLGQTIYTHDYNTEKVQIDVAALPSGVYFIRINGTEVRKFVKQ